MMDDKRRKAILSMDPEELLTPAEVAQALRVDPKTVGRWAATGRFQPGETMKTPGGHLRVKVRAIQRLYGAPGVRVATP